MSIPICIFEDEKYRNFLPLTYVRPVYDLRCGIFTIREKIQKYYSTNNIVLHARKYLENLLIEENKESKVNQFDSDTILFINGRIRLTKELFEIISVSGDEELFISDNQIIAARLQKDSITKVFSEDNELPDFTCIDIPSTEIDAYLFEYPWHIIKKNGEEIVNDIKLLNPVASKIDLNGVYLINEENIFVEDEVTLKPNVTLDASNGPIYISKGTRIFSNVYIAGPVYIGENSFLKASTQIYYDTTIGPVCKVGGEIENSIIHSYSNKQHEGYLGHSYLGSWVNIGASSNNSDLKNNYGNVKVIIDGEEVNTESQFMGLIMGDHSKCAINTMFNTGTVVGISSNIFGGGFQPKYIPSFSWGGSDGLSEYELRKAIEVAKTVKSRRNKNITTADLEVFKKVFEITKKERKKD